MKFIIKLFLWFSSEAVTGALSQAIAESISQNPFVYYPVLVICFAIGSLVATIGLFKNELERINLIK